MPLWSVGGRPGAMVVRHGEGRVILVADPSLATYNGLWDATTSPPTLRDDNVLFLVNVAAMNAEDGKVYFDEYHHGFQSGGGFWGYLRYHGEHLLLLPLFLAAGAGLWLWAVRLGPATPTPRTSETDAVDYASALARLYRQAGARRRLARTLARGFLGALTRQLRLRRNALPAEVLAAWRLHDPGPSGERLQGLLRGVAELRKGDVTESPVAGLVAAVRPVPSGDGNGGARPDGTEGEEERTAVIVASRAADSRGQSSCKPRGRSTSPIWWAGC